MTHRESLIAHKLDNDGVVDVMSNDRCLPTKTINNTKDQMSIS